MHKNFVIYLSLYHRHVFKFYLLTDLLIHSLNKTAFVKYFKKSTKNKNHYEQHNVENRQKQTYLLAL